MNGCILLISTALSLVAPDDASRKTFQLGQDGTWTPLAPTTTIAPKPTTGSTGVALEPELAQLNALLKAGQFAQARDQGIVWLKANPSSPNYDRGLYIVAQALRGVRNYVKAFFYCDELCDEHSESPLFESSMQLQYELADDYLLGLKDRLLGFRIVERQPEALDMLFRIQQRAPGSPVAEKALLRTADYYWATGDFDLASDAYHAYAQTFPRSPLVPQARLREAYSNLAQFHGPAFDATPILNSRSLFHQIQTDYPRMADEEQLDAKLATADRQLARKLYLNADFYRRTGHPGAAAAVCRRVIKQYPSTPEAADAQQLLARVEPRKS